MTHFRIQTACAALALFATSAAHAQVISPAVAQATTVEAVYVALGLSKPESSGFLLLDLPEVVLPGKEKARVASALPGTGWLVLIRGRIGEPAVPVAGQPAQVLISALPFKGGQPAKGSVALEITKTESYTLLAFAQGRWFVATRQVKVAKDVHEVKAAKAERAARVAAAMAPKIVGHEGGLPASAPR